MKAFILPLVLASASAFAAELPLHPEDLAAMQKLVTRAGLDAGSEVNPKQGWPNLKGQPAIRYTKHGEKAVLLIGLDPNGHVISVTGNGPLLSNESFEWLAALPKLRSIRIDHNTPRQGSTEDVETYDGSGIAPLAESKLDEIKTGHAFDNDGMAALAKVKSLRSVTIGHSRATDAGMAHLANHPNIEEFIIKPSRPNRITDKATPALATLPKLKRLGIRETYVTYEGGLKHLQPLKGRLEFVSFKDALVLPADVEKLKADHPRLEVETSIPAEIRACRSNEDVENWASPEAVAYS